MYTISSAVEVPHGTCSYGAGPEYHASAAEGGGRNSKPEKSAQAGKQQRVNAAKQQR